MSRTTVLERVVAMVGAIEGIHSAEAGEPDELPGISQGWRAYIEVAEPRFEPVTFGTGGTIHLVYPVTIRVYLGPPDMTKRRAQNASLRIASRMRAKFYGDRTLRNNTGVDACWDALLTSGVGNYSTFQRDAELPKAEFTLEVTEETTYNADAG